MSDRRHDLWLDGDLACLPISSAVGPPRVGMTAITLDGPQGKGDSGQRAQRRKDSRLGLVPILAVEAQTEAEHERKADAPTLPELVGASEVAGMLGVSRQRVYRLREHSSFPAPLVEVAMGPLWDARAVQAFAAEWDRRPGRPRLQVAQ